MAIGSEYYIELEPNIELANLILSGKPVAGTPDSEAREGRTIIGTDNRSVWSGSNSVPATTIGFNESRGSGVRINDTTLYTAAHVVYDTQVGNNWFCANGTTATGCNRPRWRLKNLMPAQLPGHRQRHKQQYRNRRRPRQSKLQPATRQQCSQDNQCRRSRGRHPEP